MKIKSTIIGLLTALILSGCSLQPSSLQAFEGTPMPNLEMPVHHSEKAGPILVTPNRVALGKEIEVKIEDVTSEQMVGLGVALLDPSGTMIQTVAPVQSSQRLVVPADGQVGAYKVWLASSSMAANTGINLVVIDVYDPVQPVLRNPDPIKIVESYFNALATKNYALAWQALSSDLASPGRVAWSRGIEGAAESIKLIKITPQQTLKPTDQSYRCTVELEIKPRAKGITLGKATRTIRNVTLRKESGGWRIDRIAMLP